MIIHRAARNEHLMRGYKVSLNGQNKWKSDMGLWWQVETASWCKSHRIKSLKQRKMANPMWTLSFQLKSYIQIYFGFSLTWKSLLAVKVFYITDGVPNATSIKLYLRITYLTVTLIRWLDLAVGYTVNAQIIVIWVMIAETLVMSEHEAVSRLPVLTKTSGRTVGDKCFTSQVWGRVCSPN